jgi:ABC-2 type transport system ATP-binding protein
VKPAILTRGLRKEFRYLNPGSNRSTSDQWLDYIISLVTGKNANGLGVERRHVVAVDSLDLEVQQGEFFGLLGPNGAGKTTSIKMLATILTPSAGEAAIDGYDVLRDREAVRASINVVQSGGWLGFDHNVSIRWNLRVWGRIYGLSRREAARRTDEVLDAVGLLDKAEESSGVLSSGQRQRLALAKGFLTQAPILLCDEPTVGLDPNAAYSARSLLKDEVNRKRGQTVLLTTHYMQEADQLCDRVAIMDRGRVIACDTPDRLKGSVLARALVLEIASFHADSLLAFKRLHSDWHLVERLNQEGSGSIRVLTSRNEAETSVVDAAASSGARVIGWIPDEITLEDVFIVLTGRRLAA